MFLSVNSTVIVPARTSKDSKSNKTVIATDQTNKSIRLSVIPPSRMLITVVIL